MTLIEERRKGGKGMGVCVSIPSWTDLNIPCLDIPFFLLSVLEISIAAGFFELM
jgi:hypothetical protein